MLFCQKGQVCTDTPRWCGDCMTTAYPGWRVWHRWHVMASMLQVCLHGGISPNTCHDVTLCPSREMVLATNEAVCSAV